MPRKKPIPAQYLTHGVDVGGHGRRTMEFEEGQAILRRQKLNDKARDLFGSMPDAAPEPKRGRAGLTLSVDAVTVVELDWIAEYTGMKRGRVMDWLVVNMANRLREEAKKEKG